MEKFTSSNTWHELGSQKISGKKLFDLACSTDDSSDSESDSDTSETFSTDSESDMEIDEEV